MKFLIVDDEVIICQHLVVCLSQYARCFWAATPTKALELFNAHLRKEPFDAVFLDIAMPGFSGHDLAELIRLAEKNRGVDKKKRVDLVFVSAHDDIGNISRAVYQAKAKCFIKKPFTEKGLIATLKDCRVI